MQFFSNSLRKSRFWVRSLWRQGSESVEKDRAVEKLETQKIPCLGNPSSRSLICPSLFPWRNCFLLLVYFRSFSIDEINILTRKDRHPRSSPSEVCFYFTRLFSNFFNWQTLTTFWVGRLGTFAPDPYGEFVILLLAHLKILRNSQLRHFELEKLKPLGAQNNSSCKFEHNDATFWIAYDVHLHFVQVGRLRKMTATRAM